MADVLSAEVAIVGAGVAGAIVAAKLAEAGVDVLLVEAGPRITRGEAVDAFYQSPARGAPRSPYPDTDYAPRPSLFDPGSYVVETGPDQFGPSYERIVGGTTWHYDGTTIRLLPDDLRLKSRFGLGLDWPIDYDELEPWYGAAEQEMGVAGDSRDDLGSPRSRDYPLPAMPFTYLDQQIAKALQGSRYRPVSTPQSRNTADWNGRPVCCGSNSCVQVCPTGAKYDAMVHVERAEAAGARLMEQAVVHRVELDADRRVSGLRVKRPDGSEGDIRAKVFVLAAHGIETAKILLMSRGERSPDGVANGSGQVGRNLMDHRYRLSWALSKAPLYPFRGPVRVTSIESLRNGDWRSERPAYRIVIGNTGWSWPTRAPLSTVRELVKSGLRGKALDQAIFDQTSRQFTLAAMMEQLPDPANRIVPDFDKRDAIGIPRPKISYRIEDYVKAGMAEAKTAHDEIFALIGTSEVHHEETALPGGHIIGTYRMGDDAKTSVVDSALRAHDHKNLFLLGSGVFPTSGAANPTLTIAALSLRAVAPIKATLQG